MTFYHSKNNYDDLHSAIQYNGHALHGWFEEKDLKEIVAEVCGEHDGCDWWWVVRIRKGGVNKWALLTGGCDYTGWDCQSSLSMMGIYKTALAAARAAPKEDSYNRNIRKNLSMQVQKKQPFALYVA